MQVINYTGTTFTTHYVWTGLNTLNQMWSTISLSNAMLVTSIDCYWSGYQASSSGYHIIWDASGKIVAQSSTVSVTGTSQWYTGTLANPVYLTAGTYYVGVWRDPSKSMYVAQWNSNTSNPNLYQATYTSAPSNMTNAGSTASANGVLAGRLNGYPPMKIWNGSSWVYPSNMYVWNGSAWVPPKQIYVWNGSSWVNPTG